MRSRSCPLFRCCLVFILALARPAAAQVVPPEFKQLKYRSIGPAVGGRVSRAAGVPGDPLTYYAAASSGGVWKSSDGGVSFKPIFDDQPTQAIGSLAVAPSDPNVIYVGSGEANIRGNAQPGNGIYRSTDAGKTWKHVWKQRGQIGTMIVHPTNPDIAFAAVLGHAFGPNEERGVYRTSDGGKTWQRVLFKNQDTGASDVCFDPNNPRILFAGLWQTRRKPWEMTSGGPGSGLYVSRDGGDSWTQLLSKDEEDKKDAKRKDDKGGKTKLCEGLPEGIWGRIAVGVAASDSQRVYALIEAENGGLFRSDDGGDSWSLVNGGRGLRQRAWYFTTLTIHPRNADVIFCPQVPLLKSIDGGKSFARVKGPHHGDHHDLWIDPKNPERMIDSNDGGVDVSTNGGQSWYAPPLPICQFYHVACDTRTPYWVSGCIQDIGTASGPSNSLVADTIPLSAWHYVGGGETGFTAPDPSDPNIVYAGEYGGFVSRYDHRTRQAQSIGIYPYNASGHAASDLKVRFQWTAPLLISPHNPKLIYHAANVLFKTTNAGLTWEKISPDLTRNDKTKQLWSGGPITGDNTGVEVYDTIFAVAESPKQKDLLWVGSDDGLVHVSFDGGKKWKNVTPPKMPEWGTVTCIEASPFEAKSAYVVVDCHKLDDNRPYLFFTDDAGVTWKDLTAGMSFAAAPKTAVDIAREAAQEFRRLDKNGDGKLDFEEMPPVLRREWVHYDKNQDKLIDLQEFEAYYRDGLGQQKAEPVPFVYLRAVREDPKKRGMLYAGTSAGVAFSTDAGQTWRPLKLNLPAVQVCDLVVKDDDLVVGTEGRSLWILDDLTPIRPFSGDVQKKDVYLFEPTVAYRYRYSGALQESLERGGADNPPAGAILHYYLRTKPKGEVVLEVFDAKDKLVRRLSSKEEEKEPQEEGDYSETKEDKTVSAEAGLQQTVWDLRYAGAPLIKKAKVDSGNPKIGPLVDPGVYTLKLTVDGKTATTKLEVKQDPRVKTPAKELTQHLDVILAMRDDISRVTRTVEQLRLVRRQIFDQTELLKDHAQAAELDKSAKAVLGKLEALEEKLHNPRAKIGYDILAQKGGARLYSQLVWLYDQLKESDGPMTQGISELYGAQRKLLETYEGEWRELLTGDLARLNEQLRGMGGAIILPAPAKAK